MKLNIDSHPLAGRRRLAEEQSNWEQVCRAIGLVLKRA